MTSWGAPGADLHTMTGEYVYPNGPDHYGRGILLCEATGKTTEWGVYSSSLRPVGDRKRWICEWCATAEEVRQGKSLRQLNDERAEALR